MKIEDLSFVAIDENGLPIMWAPKSKVHSWSVGTSVGRKCADELINYMRDTGNFSVLRSVVNAMPCEPAGSVETGFFNRIAEYAAGSSLRTARQIRPATAHPAA